MLLLEHFVVCGSPTTSAPARPSTARASPDRREVPLSPDRGARAAPCRRPGRCARCRAPSRPSADRAPRAWDLQRPWAGARGSSSDCVPLVYPPSAIAITCDHELAGASDVPPPKRRRTQRFPVEGERRRGKEGRVGFSAGAVRGAKGQARGEITRRAPPNLLGESRAEAHGVLEQHLPLGALAEPRALDDLFDALRPRGVAVGPVRGE